jgi:predicted acylesterase/phospholipase RssA
VIKYFDEHHMPIDYVSGASMGGLVGGFYATGLTAVEVEGIATYLDWSEMLNPTFASSQAGAHRTISFSPSFTTKNVILFYAAGSKRAFSVASALSDRSISPRANASIRPHRPGIPSNSSH